MKNLILIALTAFVFVGCSQKCQDLDALNKSSVKIYGENRFGVDAKDKTEVGFSSPSYSSTQTLATIYFNFDKFNIRSNMRGLISKNARILNNPNMQNKQIVLEGNCDELGSKLYNKTLGLKRANSVKNALKANGISLGRMKIVSFGKDNPVCTQRTKNCRAKNRRVNIAIK